MGLIASLLLVIVLIVVLLFNHYYSLLDTDAVKVNNSKPMTYSDVDLSRADTIDKEAEDEKMRKQLAEKRREDLELRSNEHTAHRRRPARHSE